MSDFIPQYEQVSLGDLCMRLERAPKLNECCERLVHPSGMTLLHIPKQMTQSYALLIVRFGARDVAFRVNGKEVRVPDGTAHFLEHKMFARPDGTDANEALSALGAESNAWTDYDRTAYLFSTTEPPKEALGVLLDFVLTPYFTEQNVAHERGIIREEISMGEDDPWQQLYEQTMRAVYFSHPIRRRICGTEASIEDISAELLHECHRCFYRPDNMYLVVCGDMDMKDIVAVVDAALAGRPSDMALRRIERTQYTEPQDVKERRVSAHANVSRPMLQIAVKDGGMPKDAYGRLKRETAMNLLSEVLFSRAGGFYNRLFEQGLISPIYSYGFSTTADVAYHAITAETDDVEAIWKEYLAEIDRARREGLDRDEIERYRRVLYASFVSEFDFPEDIADLACEAEGNGCGAFDALRAIAEVTASELDELLHSVFDEQRTTLSVLYPKEQQNEKGGC